MTWVGNEKSDTRINMSTYLCEQTSQSTGATTGASFASEAVVDNIVLNQHLNQQGGQDFKMNNGAFNRNVLVDGSVDHALFGAFYFSASSHPHTFSIQSDRGSRVTETVFVTYYIGQRSTTSPLAIEL